MVVGGGGQWRLEGPWEGGQGSAHIVPVRMKGRYNAVFKLDFTPFIF